MNVGPSDLQWMTLEEVVRVAEVAYGHALTLVSPADGEPWVDEEGGEWASVDDWTEWLAAVFRAHLQVAFQDNFDRAPRVDSSHNYAKLRAFVRNGGQWA